MSTNECGGRLIRTGLDPWTDASGYTVVYEEYVCERCGRTKREESGMPQPFRCKRLRLPRSAAGGR